MKSLKPVTVDKKLLKESAEIVKNAGSFKKQSKLIDPKIAVFIRSYLSAHTHDSPSVQIERNSDFDDRRTLGVRINCGNGLDHVRILVAAGP